MLIVSMFFPIKFSVKFSELKKSESSIYLCKYVDYTEASWELIGNKDGLFKADAIQNVIVDGLEPPKSLSDVILNNTKKENIYIIYGEVIGEKKYDDYPESKPQKVIKCKKWSLLYPIMRGDSIRPFAPKSYLTIYDFNWHKSESV